MSWREWVRATGGIALLTGASTVLDGHAASARAVFSLTSCISTGVQLGWLGGAARTGSLAGTLLGYRLSGRGAFRPGIQAGAACALLAWLCAAFAGSFGMLVLCRTITPARQVGAVFPIVPTFLANSEPRARAAFSVMSGVRVVCGSLHRALLPWLLAQFGYATTVGSLVLWFGLILSCWGIDVRRSDAGRRRGGERRDTAMGGVSRAPACWSACCCFTMAATTFWAYSERIASAARAAATEIAVSDLDRQSRWRAASILGAALGERFGFVPILILATVAAMGGELADGRRRAPPGSTSPGNLFSTSVGYSAFPIISRCLAGDRRDPRGRCRPRRSRSSIAGILGPLAVANGAIRQSTTRGLFVRWLRRWRWLL